MFNSMISAFGTGPTPLTVVLWDQAESDSFPQTLPGYYGCQTVAHVTSWRQWFRDPQLPWVFVHLQPCVRSVPAVAPFPNMQQKKSPVCLRCRAPVCLFGVVGGAPAACSYVVTWI